MPISDRAGKIIGLRMGQTKSWSRVTEGVMAATTTLQKRLRRRVREHRRGCFAFVKYGFSYGNGQVVASFSSPLIVELANNEFAYQRPSNFSRGPNARALHDFYANKFVQTVFKQAEGNAFAAPLSFSKNFDARRRRCFGDMVP